MDHLREHPDTLDLFWRFARGDTTVADFEDWLYSNRYAERALGKDAYLDAISVDFRDPKQIADLRARLLDGLPSPAGCDCHLIADHESVVMGHRTEGFEFAGRKAGAPAWLYDVICRTCDTHWTAAEESLIYDVLILVRGSHVQMPEALSYRGLLSLAAKSGVVFRYADPWHSIELPAAIERLARENAGISLTEQSDLLPVERDVVRHHAGDVVAETGLSIDFDH